jgi:ABC-type transport system involved in cytochrome c biogenesis permease subunit
MCVGFVASVMYLTQAWKLRHKVPPNHGLRLLSLERLDLMNRRAFLAAFPLLTVGLLIGALLWQSEKLPWTDPKVLSAGLFWVMCLAVLYLRYGLHQHGRRVALMTIAAFGCLLLVFVVQFFLRSSHPSGGLS